jgi:hypothetical protein
MQELTVMTKLPGCGCCKFWRQDADTRQRGEWGECRRMPPSLPPIEEDKLLHVGIWPHTAGEDWCGEWQDSGETEPGQNHTGQPTNQ